MRSIFPGTQPVTTCTWVCPTPDPPQSTRPHRKPSRSMPLSSRHRARISVGVSGGNPAFARSPVLGASRTHHPDSCYFCCFPSGCRSPSDSHSLDSPPKYGAQKSLHINRTLEITQNVTGQVSSGSGTHPSTPPFVLPSLSLPG